MVNQGQDLLQLSSQSKGKANWMQIMGPTGDKQQIKEQFYSRLIPKTKLPSVSFSHALTLMMSLLGDAAQLSLLSTSSSLYLP